MIVDSNGDITMGSDLRIMYSTMLTVRCNIVVSTKMYLAPALTIGIRYSTVRRQFKNISG